MLPKTQNAIESRKLIWPFAVTLFYWIEVVMKSELKYIFSWNQPILFTHRYEQIHGLVIDIQTKYVQLLIAVRPKECIAFCIAPPLNTV